MYVCSERICSFVMKEMVSCKIELLDEWYATSIMVSSRGTNLRMEYHMVFNNS